MHLSNSTGPLIIRGDAVGTINDNDSATVSITNRTVTEGNSGTTDAVFTVSINTPYPGTELEAICRAEGYLPQNVSFDELRVRRGNVSTSEFSAAELERMVTRELLRHKLSLVTRPRVFFERVVARAWRDPDWVLGHGARLMSQWRGRRG